MSKTTFDAQHSEDACSEIVSEGVQAILANPTPANLFFLTTMLSAVKAVTDLERKVQALEEGFVSVDIPQAQDAVLPGRIFPREFTEPTPYRA